MKIDLTSLAFGYHLREGTATPNWATALGQGREYKINDNNAIHELLKGMVYSSVSLSNISFKLGRGGRVFSGDDPAAAVVLAAVFSKVFVNNVQITDGKFILIITRDTSSSHAGRLRLKYGPSNSFQRNGLSFSNETFFNRAKKQLSLADNACWFVSDISVVNQDELALKAVIINPNGPEEYANTAALSATWKSFLDEEAVLSESAASAETGDNIILYGVPGCGKSHKIKLEYCSDDARMERVVFHPDYTYTDFIGQILPVSKEDSLGQKYLSYSFIPGPFTRILKKATEDVSHNYYLIIEELNRGNAPAIFGEVFQLLDRKDGVSEYGINNADIALEVYGDATHFVKIPRNLFILATMNTADQNVFPLDTAFKRRWRMKSISNDIKKCPFANSPICNTNVTWGSFLETINNYITEFSEDNLSSEDKRLGAFFVLPEELSDFDLFSEKVFMYLWNDVFKYNHHSVFKPEYKTLEQLIVGFKTKQWGIFQEYVSFQKLDESAVSVNGSSIETGDLHA